MSRPLAWLPTGLRYATLILVALMLLLPLWWMLISSLRPAEDIFRHAAAFGWRTLWPDRLTLEHYGSALSRGYVLALGNSLLVALSTVALGILVNALAGFAFAVFEFRGKRVLFVAVLASFTMPFEAIVIPLYHLMRFLGWIDSYRALILPEVASGFVIFLFRQFFAGLPKELFEAARVDGATWLQAWWRIAMPLTGPTVATAALMLFILQWESFFWPLVAASAPDYVVVQVAIARHNSMETTDWGGMFAAASIAVGMALIPFLAFQRYYVRTIVQSGIK
jgi:ABC-type glycerol-3-phosphate transport system permease component